MVSVLRPVCPFRLTLTPLAVAFTRISSTLRNGEPTPKLDAYVTCPTSIPGPRANRPARNRPNPGGCSRRDVARPDRSPGGRAGDRFVRATRDPGGRERQRHVDRR